MLYTNVLNTIDHLHYHPSIHAESDPKASCKTRNPRFQRNAYNSREATQYADLIVNKIEYFSKLIVALEKN